MGFEGRSKVDGEELFPSDFAKVFPCMSKSGDADVESVAKGVMKYLADHGNVWRDLDWWEEQDANGIVAELIDDGYIDRGDSNFLWEALPHCVSASSAVGYSRAWASTGAKRNDCTGRDLGQILEDLNVTLGTIRDVVQDERLDDAIRDLGVIKDKVGMIVRLNGDLVEQMGMIRLIASKVEREVDG